MGYLFGFNPKTCYECLFLEKEDNNGVFKYYCCGSGQSESFVDNNIKELIRLQMFGLTLNHITSKKWKHCPIASSKIEQILKKK